MEEQLTFRILQTCGDSLTIRVTGVSRAASARSDVSVSLQGLSELCQEIHDFLQEDEMESYWESDIPGLGITPCIALKMIPGSRREDLLAELYIELDDGGDFSRHSCCFYIHTDRQALLNFCEALENTGAFEPGWTATLPGAEN